MINLAIDIGNTRCKLGLFAGVELIRQEIWPEIDAGRLAEYAYNQKVQNVIFSSVGQLEPDAIGPLPAGLTVLQLSAQTPLPIVNAYATPETLGKDRLAAVVGAFELFPGENCLVIDAGTCLTTDLLSAEGVYVGGNISPGIRMRLRAMHEFTARLPLVEPGPIDDLLCSSTETALRNGGQLGAILETEQLITRCEERFGPLRVLFTGGDAEVFEKSLKKKIFVNHNLVLLGLNKILRYNVPLQD